MKDIIAQCKCGVFLTVNEHRDYYETAEEALEKSKGHECPPEIEEEVRKEMIRRDTIIKLQFYPITPIGFYEIWHYDYDELIKKAKEILVDSK